MSTFATGWWGTDLGEYRPSDGTYDLYPYESLPPLDAVTLRGDFAWLAPAAPTESPSPSPYPGGPRRGTDPAVLDAALHSVGLAAPPALLRFFADASLADRIPSCTACEWDLVAHPVPNPAQPGAYLVRFLRDQQDVLFWLLNIAPDGAEVLCSPIPFDELDMTDRVDEVMANTWHVAPDFETFVYRFWLENVLWFAGNEAGPLPPGGRAYLEAYAAA